MDRKLLGYSCNESMDSTTFSSLTESMDSTTVSSLESMTTSVFYNVMSLCVENDTANNDLTTTAFPLIADNLGYNNDTFDSDTPIPKYQWPFLLLSSLVFIGGLGNVLVCLAICLERRLQNATNYFLLSLAVADLLVCVLVMPFGIVDAIYGYWPFGSTLCNSWVSLDVLSCSSSIYHMCFISVGRYIGIRNPLHARQAPLMVSRRAVMLKIAFAWLLSAIITSPITILALVDQRNVYQQSVCAISNRYFLILGSLGAFFLPMIVMVNSYVLTVRWLSRKAKFFEEKSLHNYSSQGVNESSDLSTSNNKGGTKSEKDHHYLGRTVSTSSDCSTTSGSPYLMVHQTSVKQESGSTLTPRANCRSSDISGSSPTSLRRWDSTSTSRQANQANSSSSRNTQPLMLRTLGSSLQVRNEQKATKVLGLVFFAFVFCWTPFFSVNIMVGLIPELLELIPDPLVTTFLWLGYLSSTINPVIYTIFNRNFRRAFRRILLCQIFGHSHHTNRRMSRTMSQKEPSHSQTLPLRRTESITQSYQGQTTKELSDTTRERQSSSFRVNIKAGESHNHQCNNFHQQQQRRNVPLSWKFKPIRSQNTNGKQAACDIECSL